MDLKNDGYYTFSSDLDRVAELFHTYTYGTANNLWKSMPIDAHPSSVW